MKRILILFSFAFLVLGSNSYAQQTPLPGVGDKDLRDTDVKRRSMEMERIERDAKKSTGTSALSTASKNEDPLAAKYNEIKTDYEQIQLSQDSIIKAYQTGSKIDYAQISASAKDMNKSALRLNSNLFPAPTEENADTKKEGKKNDKTKPENETRLAKSVRDLIVDLDNSIASFATSTMFQNLRVVDPKVAAKAKLDLDKIIELSDLLAAEARKSAAAGK